MITQILFTALAGVVMYLMIANPVLLAFCSPLILAVGAWIAASEAKPEDSLYN